MSRFSGAQGRLASPASLPPGVLARALAGGTSAGTFTFGGAAVMYSRPSLCRRVSKLYVSIGTSSSPICLCGWTAFRHSSMNLTTPKTRLHSALLPTASSSELPASDLSGRWIQTLSKKLLAWSRSLLSAALTSVV